MSDSPSTGSHADDPGVALMLRYQDGDEAAFDELVERYSGQVYALLTRFLGPRPNREDLVQDVFLRVIRARGTYTPTARFSTWLYRIAFNLCANAHARDSHRSATSLDTSRPGRTDEGGLDVADERAPDPADRLGREDVVRAVRAAIDELPETQRMALVLAKYEELPYAEIGEVLGSSEKAIKSLIHRARENLRASLRPFLQEPLLDDGGF